MINSVKRLLRGLGSALVIVILPVGALSVAPAAAQEAVPGIPEAYPLTPELVAAWVESYRHVEEVGTAPDVQFGIAEGADPMAGLAALGVATEAMAQLNTAVAQYGFDDFQQWTNVMFSVVFAYAILDVPAEQRAMMLQMFQQTQENLDAVGANIDAVRNLVENL